MAGSNIWSKSISDTAILSRPSLTHQQVTVDRKDWDHRASSGGKPPDRNHSPASRRKRRPHNSRRHSWGYRGLDHSRFRRRQTHPLLNSLQGATSHKYRRRSNRRRAVPNRDWGRMTLLELRRRRADHNSRGAEPHTCRQGNNRHRQLVCIRM